MLFSIGNLITLAITLVFFVAYHRLTANNRSLEKVKRLADKLQSEMNEYVAERAEELKHYGIDLDVQQKAAKIALDKLQEAQMAVAEKSQTMGTIAERFREYDQVLARLMEMTGKVDQNLAKIHEDEAFAEGVNRKLELAKKSLAALERELPLLRETFEQDAQRSLDSFRDEIMGDLTADLSSVKTELSSAREEALAAQEGAREAREAIALEAEKALESAKQRAGDVEDEAFRTLTESFDAKLSNLGQETGRHVSELRSAIVEFKESWNREAQGMLTDVGARIQSVRADLDSAVSETTEKLRLAFEKASAEETKIQASVEDAKKKIADTLADLASLETSLMASMEGTKATVEEDFASFGQAFEDHRTRFEENFNAETAALESTLAGLRADLETLKVDSFEGTKAKLSGFENEMMKELADRKSDSFNRLDAWLSDMEKTLNGITDEAGARRNAEEAKYIEEFRSHMVKVRDDLHGQLEKMRLNIETIRERIAAQNAAAMKELSALETLAEGAKGKPS
jgi:chromosome segregation ATPase